VAPAALERVCELHSSTRASAASLAGPLGVDLAAGLPWGERAEIERRQSQFGRNELPEPPVKSFGKLVAEVVEGWG